MTLNTLFRKTKAFLFHKIMKEYDLVTNYFSDVNVYYVTENADWIIKSIGLHIKKHINLSMRVTVSDRMIKNAVIHYGSINVFLNTKGTLPHPSNKIIVSFYHVVEGDPRLTQLAEIKNYVNLWITACSLTKKMLVDLGIEDSKISIIPLGIDLEDFVSVKTKLNHTSVLDKYGIPKDKLIIGSFQKDGNGWDEGNEPKLIKGPDIFCDVIDKLHEKLDLFVILTGPSRGYVKNRLRQSKVPFIHHYTDNREEIIQLFHTLDLYLICSRLEGGPYALLEAFASNTLLISTKVGMCIDVISNYENGILVESKESQEIVDMTLKLLQDKSLQKEMKKNAYKTVQHFDWKIISKKYESIYS